MITVPAKSLQPGSDSLPEKLRPLFWDGDFELVSWDIHRDYVIGRVLSAGSWESICWLRTLLNDAALRQWIERRQGRGLSSRQLRLHDISWEQVKNDIRTWVKAIACGPV